VISRRYAWPVAVLLLLALVPTALNVYAKPAPLSPGDLDGLLPRVLDGFGPAEPRERRAEWVEETFGARDFTGRKYASAFALDRKIDLFAARTYDAKKLFHFPELALSYGRSTTSTRVENIGTPEGTFPVRVLDFQCAEGVYVAAYALFYGGRPVRDPIPFILRTLPQRLVGHREPMTLVYVQAGAARGERDALAGELCRLLAACAPTFISDPS